LLKKKKKRKEKKSPFTLAFY
jgi:hypothetical protein